MKRWLSIFICFIILLSLVSCGTTTDPTATTQTSRLPDPTEVKALLVKLVDVEKRAPGIVVGMIAGDPKESWVIGYGKFSATDSRVPDGDTVFEIGSISKGFTGILLGQAVVLGEVHLDDPISLYLPEGIVAPEYEGQPVMLIDLATHGSGLPSLHTSDPFEEYTVEQMYADLSAYRLTRPPNSAFEYSNYAFGLLGDLLARRAGLPDYEALLLARISQPLGMNSTRVQVTPEMSSRQAAPHSDQLVPSGHYAKSALAASGGIRSTANDMLTFLAATIGLTKTGLQPAIQMATQPYRSISGGYYGLGWEINSIVDVRLHNGNTGGYYSFAAWDPQRKIGVVVLTNAAISIDDIGFQLLLGNTSGQPFPRSINIILITWLILTVGCLIFLVWELWKRRPAPYGARLMWLLVTIFLGPIGLVIYWISFGLPRTAGVSGTQVSPVRRALGSAAWAAAGNAVGGIGVVALQRYFPSVFGSNLLLQIIAALLLPLFVGWLVFSGSRVISKSKAGQEFASPRPLFVEVVSTCLVLAGLQSIVLYLIMRWLNLWTYPSGWNMVYPPLLGALCLGTLAGTLVAYPFHLWSLRRGLFRWGSTVISEDVPARKLIWYVQIGLTLLAFVIMLGAMFLAMQLA